MTPLIILKTGMLLSRQGRSTVINYLDTSVLYDFYVKGTRSKKVQAFLAEQQKRLAISNWCETEFYGVLGRRVRAGVLPNTLAERSARRYEQHRDQGLFSFYTLNMLTIHEASSLTRRFKLGVKSADALHLGLVQTESLRLVTSDEALAEVATELGLETHIIQ
jgi:predicted nucleic acid-binding protein